MKKQGVFLVLTASFLLVAGYVIAQTATFTKQVIDPNDSGDNKAVADIDGDGRADGILGGGSMIWYSSGENYTKYTIRQTAQTEFTTDMEAGDVDNDGDPDIVYADGAGSNNVQWLENPRKGTPAGKTADPKIENNWVQHFIGSHGAFAHDFGIADFNGDGKMDAVTSGDSGGGQGQAHVWLQNNKDSWQNIDISQHSRRGIAVADINKDGKPDIAYMGGWLQNNGGTSWTPRPISGIQGDAIAAGELNGDGRPDIMSMEAHNYGQQVLMFFAPADPTSSTWTQKVLDPNMGAHRPAIADFNNDGKNDILLGLELQETSVYMGQGGGNFQKTQIDTASGHNARVGDINGDGKLDIFAADWIGHPPVKVYINTMSGGIVPTAVPPPGGGLITLDKWQYVQVSGSHHQTFGLGFGDIDGDGRKDIVSGFYWYKNPGGNMTGAWIQSAAFPNSIEAAMTHDVNSDGRTDVIGQKTGNGQEIYALINNGGSFTPVLVGSLPQASHSQGAQGYKLVKIRGGAKPEIVFTSGGGMYYFVIPANPSLPNWEQVHVTPNTSDEGLGFGDIDGDGRIDLAATTGNTTNVEWYKNPGTSAGNWQTIHVGDMAGVLFPDRTEVVDVDIDGKLDIVTTEENGAASGARAFWYKNPGSTAGNWTRTEIVNQGTMNNLDIGDVNRDGKADLVIAEHAGQLRVQVWENRGGGQLVQHLVSQGRESHLGGRVFDLDDDGDLDIISIAYHDNQFVHLWRNDNGIGTSGCAQKTSGDANCDGKITLLDFEVWRREFKGLLTTKTADFDSNGTVSLADFERWRRTFKGV